MNPNSGWSSYLGVVERAWAPDTKMHGLLIYHEFDYATVQDIAYFSNDEEARPIFFELLNYQLIIQLNKHQERTFTDEDFKDFVCEDS